MASPVIVSGETNEHRRSPETTYKHTLGKHARALLRILFNMSVRQHRRVFIQAWCSHFLSQPWLKGCDIIIGFGGSSQEASNGLMVDQGPELGRCRNCF